MPLKQAPKLKVRLNEENPEPVEVIAQSIITISEAMKRITESRMNRRALVALIHDNSKLGKSTIEIVLNNLESLEEIYLKKAK